MLILNHSHPLAADQRAQIKVLTGESITEVREIPGSSTRSSLLKHR